MGFDVTGVNPKNRRGRMFSCNLWAWHPLWSFVSLVASDILTEEQQNGGHYNCPPTTVAAETSLEIARRLRQILKQPEKYEDGVKKAEGRARLEQRGLVKALKELSGEAAGGFHLDRKTVAAFAGFCESSGGFRIT
ncbi:MAG: hypothetical protein QUS33_07290 [Dehalococcoidia bacterium]|nr:hypothetical protein [Dehalococcoidia bacterium]